MARVSIGRLWWSLLAAVALISAAACTEEADPPEWGSEAEQLFTAWTSAWSSGDPFDTVAFYSPTVNVIGAHPDLDLTSPAAYHGTVTGGQGRAWLYGFIEGKTRPRERTAEAVFIDGTRASVVLTVPDMEAAAWFGMQMEGGVIGQQLTLRWRDAHKPGGEPDRRLAWVDDLVADYLTAWSAPDPESVEALYAPDASVSAYSEPAATDRDAIVAAADALRLRTPSLWSMSVGTSVGPAVFVTPGATTRFLSFIVEEGGACPTRTNIFLGLEGAAIVEEIRLVEPDSVRRCGPVHEPGWWSGLGLPPPVDEQVTGRIASGGGDITIINGTADLERLVAWGVERFSTADVNPPVIESVMFAPVPQCVGAAGVTEEQEDGPPGVVHCVDAYTACVPSADACEGFAVSARFGLLHEFAHVWLLQELDDRDRAAYVEHSQTDAWRDGSVPWHRRGVEHAAETLAWGLMDEAVGMARLGDPTCEASALAFRSLTGRSPLVSCE